ncbi:unnamed protein product, partial [Phaeothamnion confervicola]
MRGNGRSAGGGGGGRSSGSHGCARRKALALAVAYNNAALTLVVRGRLIEACRLLRAAVALLPAGNGPPSARDVSQPSFNLALVLWRLGRRDAACVHWLRARGHSTDAGAARHDALLRAARLRLADGGGGDRNGGGSRSSDRGHAPLYPWEAAGGGGGGLRTPPSQACALDVLVFEHW